VVLFGGTFDPPHRAHVELADLARRRVARTHANTPWLVFVPAARSPHKPNPPIASDRQRIAMVRLATADLPRCTIWTDEIDRARAGEPSYWADTIARAREAVGPVVPLWFLVGSDQAVRFHRWRQPRRILELADPLVLPREPITAADALRQAMAETGAWSEPELDRWTRAFVPIEALRAASTAVREGGTETPGTPMAPAVLEYARREGLYGLAGDASGGEDAAINPGRP